MLRGLTRRGGRPVVLTASVLALALAAACGSLGENGFSPGGPNDGGSPYDAFTGDVAADSSPDVGSSPDAGTPPTVLFVQASPSLPDVRLCWASGGEIASIVPFPSSGAMPGSNYPGIPLGGGAGLSDVGVLSSGAVTLYAIDAENLARIEQGGTQSTCDALLACGQQVNPSPPCLRYNTDYWQVAPLAQGLAAGTNVVALAGCLPFALDPLASTSRCGASWNDVTGNLHAESARLLPMTQGDAGAGQIVAQAALLSPAVAGEIADGGEALVSFGSQDGGSITLGTLTVEAETSPSVSTLSIGSDLSAFDTLGFSVSLQLAGDGGDADGAGPGSAGYEWMSLAQAQQLVDPTEDPTVFFGQPRTYLVAVLGDPGAVHAFAPSQDGGYDGTGLHILVLASPPPPPPPSSDDAGEAGDL
jgi:hypothetical protein